MPELRISVLSDGIVEVFGEIGANATQYGDMLKVATAVVNKTVAVIQHAPHKAVVTAAGLKSLGLVGKL